jgi:uncharacterized membrane protein
MENSNKKDILMGILAYLGILVIIPYLVAKNDPFVKFHIKQGLVLVIIEVIGWVLALIFWPLWMLFWIGKLVIFILVIIGIVNVVQGTEKNLPLVGGYAQRLNI